MSLRTTVSRRFALSLAFFSGATALAVQGCIVSPGPTGASAATPKGLFTNFRVVTAVNQAQVAAYPGVSAADLPAYPNPALTPDPTDAVLKNYFASLLGNSAVSGLAGMIDWTDLNPADPSKDPAQAYTWNVLDDIFSAVDTYNRTASAPKFIQLILSGGFNSPSWLFSEIDKGICNGASGCTGSCDGLFTVPAPSVSAQCGYTTIFYRTEGNPVVQLPLPLPWGATYKSEWKTFLTALNARVQQEPSSSAFVSIAVAGPTASSAEMILPNSNNQVQGSSTGVLVLQPAPTGPLQPGQTALPGIDTPAAWNLLIGNHYGSSYLNSDQAFIEEWNDAIDVYAGIFNGVTLVLTTSTDGLPSFPGAATGLLTPAAGFESDCDDPSTDPTDAMACAAVTQVLTHFDDASVGGGNAKATQESGMTAAKPQIDLGPDGIKWLTTQTAGAKTPVLGGLQFSTSFSNPGTIQSEGCGTGITPKNQTPCPGLTPEQALFNVLQLAYFPGTVAAPAFSASSTVSGEGNFSFSNAKMNFLQVYDTDIVYAMGLSGCKMLAIAGDPAGGVAPATGPCAATGAAATSAQNTQTNLDLANREILLMAR